MVEWDPAKADENTRKHGVEFRHAETVFADVHLLLLPSEWIGEARWSAIGSDGLGRILMVVYTWRGDRRRLISARRATRRERRTYEATRR
ncbi:MAG: BrnT family toxin [Deltaproteobacteria bacterium]|nr:BrnT family toxin [Deltaproteobacteria bacterium]